MSRIDQNRVNLGPAKIKTEDAIYDSVDQGVVGTTTTVVIPPPTVIPLPPASLQLAPGYPIGVEELGLTDLDLDGRPSISRWRWVIGDLTNSGYYSRTLVCSVITEEGQEKLHFFNLDDLSQNFSYLATEPALYELEYVIRDGVLTCGFHIFASGNWVASSVYSTYRAVLGASDAEYRYAWLQQIFITQPTSGIYRYPNIGPATIGLVKALSVDYNYLECVAGNVFWFANLNVPDSQKTLTAMTSSSTPVTYNLYPNIPHAPDIYDGRNSFFGLNNGSICFLQEVKTGPDYIYHLHTMDVLGNVTTILNFIKIRSSLGIQNYVKVPGQEYMFGITSDIPTRVYKISNFDYQEIDGLPTTIYGANWHTETGNLRLLGRNGYTERDYALYEYML